MIINENNKNNILKGNVKRGFNQTPGELKEKIFNQTNMLMKKEKPERVNNTNKENQDISPAQRIGNAFNNLKRMK